MRRLSIMLACAVAPFTAKSAAAGAIRTVDLTITDKGCEPMRLMATPEKTTFRIKNGSKRAVEWEILKGNIVVEERENILPGFSATVTTTLKPDDYAMTCGLLSNAKGTLVVAVAEETEVAGRPGNLDGVIAAYKTYVAAQVDEMVAKTAVLVDAVKAGRLAEAQKAYAPARVGYERIEPVAEVFNDLDKSMDSRADDYETKEADPNFSGFHRLEYGLFDKKSTDGLGPYADRLMTDATELKARVARLAITPKILVGGAAELIEEVASKKIAGEEDRYARTDLWDFQANLEGAQRIVALLRPDLVSRDPALVARVEANFAKVEKGLAKYRQAGGAFAGYDTLKPEDQKMLKGPITVLAEDLSKLRGTLGID